MPTLLEMPDVTMINILEKCSYKSVLALRKVCHSLRNFIDDSCFKTDLDDIDIAIDSTGFSVIFQTPDGLWTDGISSARNWTSNDLKIILKLVQNSKLSCFTVNTTPDSVRGLDDLEELLKNQARQLQTENFEMEGSEIFKVLPYLDPKTLKEIYIIPENYGTDYQNLDSIEQLIELEQFKNAVELTISNVLVRADLRKFFHFQRIIMKLHETSLEELVALQEAFVTSTHMEYFELNGRNLNEDQLEKVFGTPFRDDRYRLGRSQWFFEIRNCKEHVLRIEKSNNVIQFWKWEAKDVPKNAVVHR
ncbi:unnamed protein product [Caenorhabditis brenneri]